MAKILVVDDERNVLRAFEEILTNRGQLGAQDERSLALLAHDRAAELFLRHSVVMPAIRVRTMNLHRHGPMLPIVVSPEDARNPLGRAFDLL